MGTGGDGAGDLGQVGVHRRRVDDGQDQPCGGTARGAEGTKQIRPLMAGVAGCAGSGAAPGPDAGQGSLLTHARVRHGPRTGGGTMANFWNQISSGLSRARAGIGAATLRESFLNAACACGSDFRVLGAHQQPPKSQCRPFLGADSSRR